VSLAPRGPFVAESPEGAILWTLRVPNDPIGTAPFWIAAVEDRLADEFASPVRSQLGEWECLTLDEPGADEPYRWQVCLRPVGKKLEVAQAYFPTAEAVARYAAGVEQALSSGGGGS
jgi:hypothetical protein